MEFVVGFFGWYMWEIASWSEFVCQGGDHRIRLDQAIAKLSEASGLVTKVREFDRDYDPLVCTRGARHPIPKIVESEHPARVGERRIQDETQRRK
jgi:hypothetical protein